MHIDIFVIVPAVFRRHDAVADKDYVGLVDFDFRLKTRRGSNEIIRRFEVAGFVANHERHSWFALDPGQGSLLYVCPVRISRLQPDLFELIGDVFDRKLFPFRSRRASFEFIRCENLDMREQAVRSDRL